MKLDQLEEISIENATETSMAVNELLNSWINLLRMERKVQIQDNKKTELFVESLILCNFFLIEKARYYLTQTEITKFSDILYEKTAFVFTHLFLSDWSKLEKFTKIYLEWVKGRTEMYKKNYKDGKLNPDTIKLIFSNKIFNQEDSNLRFIYKPNLKTKLLSKFSAVPWLDGKNLDIFVESLFELAEKQNFLNLE